MYRVGKEKATRIELRSADPACNPYLAFSVMLAAGLKGINEKYAIPAPVEDNIYNAIPSEIEKREIDVLPNSLENAIKETENSELVRETLGEHIFGSLIANKQLEWDSYRVHVSQYELDKYLPML